MRSFNESFHVMNELSHTQKPRWRCRKGRSIARWRIVQIFHWVFARAYARAAREEGVLNYLKNLSFLYYKASTAGFAPRILQAHVGTFIERLLAAGGIGGNHR